MLKYRFNVYHTPTNLIFKLSKLFENHFVIVIKI